MENSLVLELQRDALDQSITTENVLRKGLVVAKKLKVDDIKDWLEHELNGYPAEVKLPEYRFLSGIPMVKNPYRGLIPLEIYDPKFKAFVSRRNTNQPIAEIETLMKNSEGYVSIRFSPNMEAELLSMMDVKMEPLVLISVNQLQGIISNVRNNVLSWALKLEDEGITGEGMTFSLKEKQQAINTTWNIGNLENYIGSMSSSQIQQKTSNSTQLYNAEPNFKKIVQIVDALKKIAQEPSIDPIEKDQLNIEIDCLNQQLCAPRPNSTIIRESLKSARNIVEGVASSGIFQGVLAMFNTL